MKVFKKKGELTKFQILAEIAKGQPHLRQKDIADKLGITVQAVSENLKTLVDEGWVETCSGQPRYNITKRGVEKVKIGAIDLRKYADQVLDTMTTYKSVWPALSREDLKEGETVWLKMDEGVLYAGKEKTSAHAKVLHDAKKGEDVALVSLGGTIELKPGFIVIIKLPTINQGGSRVCNLDQIREILEKYPEPFQRVGIMGTVSRALTDKLEIEPDFEFGTPQSAIAAAKRGLNVLVFTVGKMTRSLTKKMDAEGISYVIEDVTDIKK
ncbi:MarR family transcriptional regulator [Methanobacterium petrolearium]|uniref:DUF7839 domain-containing protein n=1 Tax=Methanobacterium petrolearium TaxID=710190 RepID=UPI001AEA36C8|nr:MarR family transcriptional regulator [Methanobacterium petrolearium]MBP1946704.1 putative transcriptional regulator [Methanobacterium petrolearium]